MTTSAQSELYDVVVVGGGPAGATAAWDLARNGFNVLLLDREGRIKPCGGAIPPQLVNEFEIPDSLLVARVTAARMIAPSERQVDMPIDGGFVGMVDREHFDAWLRERAQQAGARCLRGTFESLDRDAGGQIVLQIRAQDAKGECRTPVAVKTRLVIGADGARSEVARQCIRGADRIRYVAAYHEIIESPITALPGFDAQRCDVYYQGQLSPDFYGWVFPHGNTTSIGVGSARKGFSLRAAVTALRSQAGLLGAATVRREGAPIPLRPLRRWDNGRDVLLAGDAAGVVAPASGEGIYYAMTGGRLAARAAELTLRTSDVRHLKDARRAFMKAHGKVFLILGIMQTFWYSSDKRRERFVGICRDPDVQRLTWQAYMYKRLVRSSPMAHLRIFFKDMAHLLGLVRA